MLMMKSDESHTQAADSESIYTEQGQVTHSACVAADCMPSEAVSLLHKAQQQHSTAQMLHDQHRYLSSTNAQATAVYSFYTQRHLRINALSLFMLGPITVHTVVSCLGTWWVFFTSVASESASTLL